MSINTSGRNSRKWKIKRLYEGKDKVYLELVTEEVLEVVGHVLGGREAPRHDGHERPCLGLGLSVAARRDLHCQYCRSGNKKRSSADLFDRGGVGLGSDAGKGNAAACDGTDEVKRLFTLDVDL